MANRGALIPGGPFLNDVEEAAVRGRLIPGSPFVNEVQLTAAAPALPHLVMAPPRPASWNLG
jgi:hypothetical protein